MVACAPFSQHSHRSLTTLVIVDAKLLLLLLIMSYLSVVVFVMFRLVPSSRAVRFGGSEFWNLNLHQAAWNRSHRTWEQCRAS